MFDLRKCDLDKLNSLTKYPSIQTYHGLDPKNGRLLEDQATAFEGDVILTEKVDGTNARIIKLPDGNYVIGSRGELLIAKGDIIGNPSLGIAAALKNLADNLYHMEDYIMVYYGEFYGGKVTAHSKQYTGEKAVGFRLFDACKITHYQSQMAQPLQAISQWRENGGQDWIDEQALQDIAKAYEIDLTPRLDTLKAADVPQDLEGMSALLHDMLPKTQCALDEGAGGNAEGIVLRSADRSTIAKARFADYRRSLKGR